MICVLSIISCNTVDNMDTVNTSENVTDFKYTLKEKNEPNKLVYTQEYAFDDQGRVISEKYTDFNNSQYSYYSTFKYNDNGLVTKEIRDEKTQLDIIWTNDLAEVFNSKNQKISEFTIINGKLIEYKTEFNSSNARTRKLNYDTNGNIVSIENETEVFVEYLEYDSSKLNPLNLIKSIGMLRLNYNPYFKNIFQIEKAYPFEGDDYSFPLTYYDYNYEFDDENRVFQIEDEKTLIYTQEFSYEQ